MDFKDILFFRRMISTKIITFLYWLGLAAVLIGGLVTMFDYSFWAGLVGICLGALSVRVFCELIIVRFGIYDALQAIRASSEGTLTQAQDTGAAALVTD